MMICLKEIIILIQSNPDITETALKDEVKRVTQKMTKELGLTAMQRDQLYPPKVAINQ